MPKIIRPLPHLSERDMFRFWCMVKPGGVNECWPWTGLLDPNRYGLIYIEGIGIRAHRIACFLHTGVDPHPLLVCHKCDNPPCCNGNHLFPGTHSENSIDMFAKGRSHERRGEKNPNAKLTEKDVLAIRKVYTGKYGEQSSLGRQYGVAPTIIAYVVTRRTWSHIP